MMYPRLRLLQRLLAPTGVIFISIDDNEAAALRFVCDEIFGFPNHLTTFVWESSGNTDNQADVIGTHEYIHVYAKNRDLARINPVVDPNIPEHSKIHRDFVENSAVKNGPKNPPSVVTLPTGFPCLESHLDLAAHSFSTDFMKEASEVGYITRQLGKKFPVNYPLRLDDAKVRDGVLAAPCRVFTGWMNAKKLASYIANDCEPVREGDSWYHFYLTKTGAVYYRKDGRQSHYVQSVLRNMGTTERNKYLLEGMGLSFDYPKPVELIKYLLSLYTPKDGLILDSFAGSGTTAHATLRLNHDDGGSRRFILTELGDYAESLTAERVRQAISNDRSGRDIASQSASPSFSFYELGSELLIGGNLNPEVPLERVREYIWFTETAEDYWSDAAQAHPDFLGRSSSDTSYFFAFDAEAPTVLDLEYLTSIPEECGAEAYVIYADTCLLTEHELVRHNITFKKIPRDITRL